MQAIPLRHHAIISAFPRIVVPKTLKRPIPHGLESLYHHGLGKGDPNIVHNEKTAIEIIDIEVLRRADGICVFFKPFIQSLPTLRFQFKAAFARAGRNGLAHIDRAMEQVAALGFR